MSDHKWSDLKFSSIPNGSRTKKGSKTSTGGSCAACGLTAKAPSKPPKDWAPPTKGCP